MKPTVRAWRYKGEEDREPLHYTACGLDDVYLVSGYDRHKTPYGDGLSVNELDALHEAIGRYLACQKKELSGKELRFLRKEMDITQSELGRLIGLTAQQVARWEKEESTISGPADVLVRAFYLENLGKNVDVRELAEALESLDASVTDEKIYFDNNGQGWKKAVNQ